MIAHHDIASFVYETGSPFKRLEALLDPVRPHAGLKPIIMTVGEPRHAPPVGLAQTIALASEDFGRYPAINGSPDYRRAVAAWLTRRYGLPADLIDPARHVLPLAGSREGLVFATRCARDLLPGRGTASGQRPLIIMQNPFYQAYAGGALMAGCDVALLEDGDHRGASLSPSILQRAVAAIIASPTNPQGAVLSHADWDHWIELARLHGFYLLADECYSEIYRTTPPPGVLEVAAKSAGGLRQVITLNSLSKRSNLPGLRVGFAAGDEAFMVAFMKLRNMAAPQVPLPLQQAGTLAWSDESHVLASRARYLAKWAMVDEQLGPYLDEPTPQAGFFHWLKLPDGVTDTQAAVQLWRNHAVRSVPGSFIAYPYPNASIGTDRLRLALVDDEATTRDALTRLAHLFDPSIPSPSMPAKAQNGR